MPAACRRLGPRAGALLVGRLFQPAVGTGGGVAPLRKLAPAAGEAGGAALEPPGGGLHLVGVLWLQGVIDGGPAQRPFGDGARGHRLVVAILGAVGGRPGGTQLSDGLGVHTPGGGDLGGARQRGACLCQLRQCGGQPFEAAV